MARRAEVPITAVIGEIREPAEHADRAVAVAPPGVFHMNVINPLGERPNELHVIDVLVPQVRRIEVKAEPLVAFDRVERSLRG